MKVRALTMFADKKTLRNVNEEFSMTRERFEELNEINPNLVEVIEEIKTTKKSKKDDA